MANADTVAFNFAAFVATLFLLEFGADKFIDHTAIVSQRVGVSQAIIALLTAGAEWEEASGAAFKNTPEGNRRHHHRETQHICLRSSKVDGRLDIERNLNECTFSSVIFTPESLRALKPMS